MVKGSSDTNRALAASGSHMLFDHVTSNRFAVFVWWGSGPNVETSNPRRILCNLVQQASAWHLSLLRQDRSVSRNPNTASERYSHSSAVS